MGKIKKPELYFAEKEERAVIDYILSDSLEVKNKIYNEILIEPFKKMIQSILRKYPIHIGNYSMDEVELNALEHMIDHMIKYRPFIIERRAYNSKDDKWNKLGIKHKFMFRDEAEDDLDELNDLNDGYKYRIFSSRAFSYCQTIIRNHYKDHGRKSYTEKKTLLHFDNYSEEVNENSEYIYEMEMDGHELLEQLINTVVEKIELRLEDEASMKKNEVLVGDAIVNVLKNWQVLFMEDSPEGKYGKRVTNKFAKNKILFFLKEQTGLSTKEIRIGIKPFKEIYFMEKIDFMDD